MKQHIIGPFIFLLLCTLPFIFIAKEHSTLFINSYHNSYLDEAFLRITWLGEGFMICAAAIIAGFKKLKWLMALAIGILIHLAFIQINKMILFGDIIRPLQYFEQLNRDHLIHTIDGLRIYRTRGFPSGHTTGATLGATFIALMVKNKWASWVFALIAVVVGISRVYLIQHFLIDAYFGFLFGIVSSVLAVLIVKQIKPKCFWINWYVYQLFDWNKNLKRLTNGDLESNPK